jgi:poly-gamma-glutamate synthesis protein (capsule biosynthesis protein)
LLLAGDVNLNRPDPQSAFQHVGALLAAADLRFANLEGPLAGAVAAIPHKPGWVHSAPEMVAGLKLFDGFGVANNVTYPASAMLTSLEVLDSAGIGYCGGGRDLNEAHEPLVIGDVGFLSYSSLVFPYEHAATADTPGIATLRAATSYVPDPRVAEVPGRPPVVLTTAYPDDVSLMVSDVTTLRKECSFVVVSCHWGYADAPVLDYQRTIAHAAIDAGATLIMGHGPHSVGEMEIYRGRRIFYSLGNFVFDWPRMLGRYLEGLLLEVDTDSDAVTVHHIWRDMENNPRVTNSATW